MSLSSNGNASREIRDPQLYITFYNKEIDYIRESNENSKNI